MEAKLIDTRLSHTFQELAVGEAFMYGDHLHIKIDSESVDISVQQNDREFDGFASSLGPYSWTLTDFFNDEPLQRVKVEFVTEKTFKRGMSWDLKDGECFLHETGPCVKIWPSKYVDSWAYALNLKTYKLVELFEDVAVQKLDVKLIVKDDDNTISKEISPEQLAEMYNPTLLLDAYIIHEVETRLREIHDVSEDDIDEIKGQIITDLQNDTHVMFDYDSLDEFINERL